MSFQDHILNFEREQLDGETTDLTFSRNEVEELAAITFRITRLAGNRS